MRGIAVPRLRALVGGARTRVDERATARRMRSRLAATAAGFPDPPPLDGGDPGLTVVVPCYRHAEFLPLAVQSLLEQTLPAFDTVLVDDASPDATGALLDGLAGELAARGEVQVVRHATNLGQAATLNEAIGLARTGLVTVLNDDDWLTAGLLATACGLLEQEGSLALVGTGSRWFDGAGRPPDDPAPPATPTVLRHQPADVRGYTRPNDLNMTHSGMTLRRAAWAAVGGYRTRVADRVVPYSDRDLQLRVASIWPVAVIQEPLVWWRSDSSVDAGLNS